MIKSRLLPGLQFILSVNKVDNTLNYERQGPGVLENLVDFLLKLNFFYLLPSILIGCIIISFKNTIQLEATVGSYLEPTFLKFESS